MITQDQAFKLIEKEIQIIRQLAKKLEPSMLDYKPKEGMRTTQELLSYLNNCAYGMIAYWMSEGSSMKDFFTQLRAETPVIDLSNFDDRMALQRDNIQKIFAQIKAEDWQHKIVTYPWGEKAPLGEAIIHTSIKWLAAYKYQLFMYMKMGSDLALTTPDAWVYGTINA